MKVKSMMNDVVDICLVYMLLWLESVNEVVAMLSRNAKSTSENLSQDFSEIPTTSPCLHSVGNFFPNQCTLW